MFVSLNEKSSNETTWRVNVFSSEERGQSEVILFPTKIVWLTSEFMISTTRPEKANLQQKGKMQCKCETFL